jgi:hypothetical protein
VGDIQTAIAQTEAAKPSPTQTEVPPTQECLPCQPATEALPSATPLPTTTPTPITSDPFPARVIVSFLNMRGGPSTLFDVVDTFQEGDEVTAVERTIGGDWIHIQTGTGLTQKDGWMATQFLEFDGDPQTLPVVVFPEAQIVRGRVEDTTGAPVFGINIAVIYRTEEDELRHDAFSDEKGDFVVYLPENLLGLLDISIVGISCESHIMDDDCQLSGYFKLEGRAFVNIPQEEAIIFLYEVSTVNIVGTVLDNGTPVEGITVVAERDDGAEAFIRTDEEGNFSLPVGEGIWEVYTVIFDPVREEGERTSVEVTNETPPSIELPVP